MVAFTVFWFDVYRYGLFYLLSFLIWYFLLWFIIKNIKKKLFPKVYNLLKNKKDDFFFFIILWVMLWWRLGHFLIYYPSQLFANPLVFFQYHQWWMSFIWWIVWVATALFIFFKKNKLTKVEVWQVLDITVSIAPIWSLIWRWGNYLNQELYWIPVSESFLSKSSSSTILFLHKINVLHIYDKIDNVLRINTNLLASLWEWLFVLILVQIIFWKIYWSKNKQKSNKYWLISFIRLFAYSFVRFFLEYVRQDSQWEFVWWFTKSQRFFLIFMTICIFFIIKKTILNKKNNLL